MVEDGRSGTAATCRRPPRTQPPPLLTILLPRASNHAGKCTIVPSRSRTAARIFGGAAVDAIAVRAARARSRNESRVATEVGTAEVWRRSFFFHGGHRCFCGWRRSQKSVQDARLSLAPSPCRLVHSRQLSEFPATRRSRNNDRHFSGAATASRFLFVRRSVSPTRCRAAAVGVAAAAGGFAAAGAAVASGSSDVAVAAAVGLSVAAAVDAAVAAAAVAVAAAAARRLREHRRPHRRVPHPGALLPPGLRVDTYDCTKYYSINPTNGRYWLCHPEGEYPGTEDDVAGRCDTGGSFRCELATASGILGMANEEDATLIKEDALHKPYAHFMMGDYSYQYFMRASTGRGRPTTTSPTTCTRRRCAGRPVRPGGSSTCSRKSLFPSARARHRRHGRRDVQRGCLPLPLLRRRRHSLRADGSALHRLGHLFALRGHPTMNFFLPDVLLAQTLQLVVQLIEDLLQPP